MKKLVYISSLLLFFQLSYSQNVIKKSPLVSNDKIEILKRELHEFVDDGRLAGIQTVILKKDKIIHFDTYGYADIESKKPLNDKSIFRIFSMTKPITSVALMQLYEAGKFKLDDPLHKYIPEFKNMMVYNADNEIVPSKRDITIIDLLRHSSGISYGRSPNEALNTKYSEASLNDSENLKMFITRLATLPLLFEPGTAYEYGYSTDVCGYLIEVLSGKKVDDYIKEHVLQPLEMDDTHFQLPKNKLHNFTTGYRVGENGNLEIAELPKESYFLNKPNFIRAGGGLVSTSKDYSNFCTMLLNKGAFKNHQILKPETIDLMIQDHLEDVRKYTPRLRILPNETGFGLGFSIVEKENGHVVCGWGGAVGTYFRIDTEFKIAYIMMIQISPYRQLQIRERFQELINDCIIK